MREIAITYLRIRYVLRVAKAHWKLSGEAANEAKILSQQMPQVNA